jgi:hypothetical protein
LNLQEVLRRQLHKHLLLPLHQLFQHRLPLHQLLRRNQCKHSQSFVKLQQLRQLLRKLL